MSTPIAIAEGNSFTKASSECDAAAPRNAPDPSAMATHPRGYPSMPTATRSAGPGGLTNEETAAAGKKRSPYTRGR